MRTAFVLIAAAALAACGAPKETVSDAAPAAEDAGDSPAADDQPTNPEAPISGGEASALFAELAGVWAAPGLCGDYTQQWVIDATSINLHEMHCSVDSLEETASGVRTSGNCSVEGDDDGVADTYELVLAADGTLTIVQEDNGAYHSGLTKCGATEL